MTELVVRPIRPSDLDGWAILFAQYREFCGRSADPGVVARAWEWLMDPAHPVRGLAAVAGDRGAGEQIAGIAHFRAFPRTVDANEGIHLDDLYIAEPFRGNGTARALLAEVGRIAGAEDAEFARWVTAEDNVDAQRLYDGIAERTGWVTYEQTPAT